MKNKINETLIPFIKHLENKGYTVEKDTNMDNCIGVDCDIISAFADWRVEDLDIKVYKYSEGFDRAHYGLIIFH